MEVAQNEIAPYPAKANATRTLSLSALSNKSPGALELSPLNIYHNIQLQHVKISKVGSQDFLLHAHLTISTAAPTGPTTKSSTIPRSSPPSK
jgi:hypothetical protein